MTHDEFVDMLLAAIEPNDQWEGYTYDEANAKWGLFLFQKCSAVIHVADEGEFHITVVKAR